MREVCVMCGALRDIIQAMGNEMQHARVAAPPFRSILLSNGSQEHSKI